MREVFLLPFISAQPLSRGDMPLNHTDSPVQRQSACRSGLTRVHDDPQHRGHRARRQATAPQQVGSELVGPLLFVEVPLATPQPKHRREVPVPEQVPQLMSDRRGQLLVGAAVD